MNQKGLSVMVAGPIWHKFMQFALADHPPQAFAAPGPPSPVKPVFRGQYRSGTYVKIDKVSGKLATAATPPELVEEKSFGPAVSILGIINKDDPVGDTPPNPSDPQYANWQAGIDRWLAGHTIGATTPPSAYDDIHTAEKTPRIAWISPDKDATGAASRDELVVSVLAPLPLREVSLFVDDELKESKTAPFLSSAFSFYTKTPIEKGTHRFRVSAYDAVGNQAAEERTLTIE
jgi:hypothetical protein